MFVISNLKCRRHFEMSLCFYFLLDRSVWVRWIFVGFRYRLALSFFLVCHFACTFCHLHSLLTCVFLRCLQDRKFRVKLLTRYRLHIMLVSALFSWRLLFAAWLLEGMTSGTRSTHGFWNLIIFYQRFSRKMFFLYFELIKWNLTTVGLPKKIHCNNVFAKQKSR